MLLFQLLPHSRVRVRAWTPLWYKFCVFPPNSRLAGIWRNPSGFIRICNSCCVFRIHVFMCSVSRFWMTDCGTLPQLQWQKRIYYKITTKISSLSLSAGKSETVSGVYNSILCLQLLYKQASLPVRTQNITQRFASSLSWVCWKASNSFLLLEPSEKSFWEKKVQNYSAFCKENFSHLLTHLTLA